MTLILLSITRLPALELIQAGHESGQNAMFRGPGLFHMNIAGALSTHFGKPDTSLRDPDSFPYENTRLDSTEGEKTPLTGFRPPSELPAPATENSPTNLSPPLINPAAAPVEDVVKGMLVEESVEREPEEVCKRG